MLLFSKRTTTAVTVFACLFAAQNAQSLTSTPATIAALQLEYATLNRIYRLVIHQDVANQHSVLDDIIDQAATTIGQLNATVQAMPQPNPPPEDIFALSDIQTVLVNAVRVMIDVQAAE